MRAVVYIDRNSLYYYGGNIGKPISLAIPDTILQDIEVIDDVAFKKLLFQFLKKYAIKPALIMVCFSSQSYFKKELEPQKEAPDIPTLLSDFAEIVPFDHVLTKIFTYQKKSAVIALNRDVAYLIRDSVELFGFKVEGIIPTYILLGESAQPFSLQLAQLIIKHFSSLQAIGFPVHEIESTITELNDNEFSGADTPEKKANHLYVMIGVFAVLILILIYMFFFYKKTPSKKNSVEPAPTQQQQQQQQRSTPSPKLSPEEDIQTPTQEVEPTIVAKKKSELEIQILNGSGLVGQAGDLQEVFEDAGFEHITLGNAPTQTADKALIVVNEYVSQITQREIQSILTELDIDSRIRTSNDIEGDILITTFQSPNE